MLIKKVVMTLLSLSCLPAVGVCQSGFALAENGKSDAVIVRAAQPTGLTITCIADDPVLVIAAARAIADAVSRHDAAAAATLAGDYLRTSSDKALEAAGLPASPTDAE